MIIFSCGKKNIAPPSLPVVDVVGKVVVTLPSQKCKVAMPGMTIPMGSRIAVPPASKILIGMNRYNSVSAMGNTFFSLDSIIGVGPRTLLAMSIDKGKIFCSIRIHITTNAFKVSSMDQNTCVSLRIGKDGRNAVLKTIGGPVAAVFPDSQPSVVPSCCKMLVREGQKVIGPTPLTTSDFEEIVSFVGKTIADSIIDNAFCPQTIQNEQNPPPQWEKTPKSEGEAGKQFIDTLVAGNPEGGPITYKLINGPQGMNVDAKSGVVRFFPKLPGTYSVQVSASDSSNIPANMTYELFIIAPSPKPGKRLVNAVINLPGMAVIGEPIRIDASQSASSKTLLKNLLFRFDINGDGVWDYPSTGAFGAKPVVTHVFKAEGVYTVRVQVKTTDGKIVNAQNKIAIHEKPGARIFLSPPTAFVNKECVFDAGRSSISPSSASFEVRWDLDNNGTWDYPENGGYTTMKTMKKTWNKAGLYTVVLEIKDRFGSMSWANVDVNVHAAQSPAPAVDSGRSINKPAMVKAGGNYLTHVNSPVELKGEALSPDSKIERYSWDFQGDGAYDTSLTTTAKMQHTYSKPGTYRAVLKIVTNDSKEWFDTATVVVINSPPVAHGGKDILSTQGKKITLHGTGEDPDGRIALYEWDFEGDGSYDWSSQKNGDVKHVFNQYSYAAFRVTDGNGATGCDTLRVVICPEGMTGVEPGPFCIDNYEWPNSRGKEPLRDISFFEARNKCLSAGKRLCAGNEWEAACAGEHGVQYPKSSSPVEQNCNVVGNRFFSNRIAPSGSFPDCKSPAGVYDMNGNVEEWTDGFEGDSAFVYGGSWHHDLAHAQCSSRLPLIKSKGFFYVGFRCCK